MKTKRTKFSAGARVAAAVAGVAGKQVVKKLAAKMAEARDAALIEVGKAVGSAARKRRRARAAKTVLKRAGAVALVTGATAATVIAGRAVMHRRHAH